MNKPVIIVEAEIEADITTVWGCWTSPEHIVAWNAASDDWHCPSATNDLRVGGRFCYTMAAKDGSVAFDFEGTYDVIEQHARIAYTLGDGRKVVTDFTDNGETTYVRTAFDPEHLNTEEMQRAGWQSILDNFKRHVEGGVV